MWDLPGLGIKPEFPGLADGVLTTGPPGISHYILATTKIILNNV